MSKRNETSFLRVPMAGLLSWIMPGLGHIYLGDRGRGIVLLVAVTATFWTGVAIGGVQNTIDPHGHRLWFMAQLCNGGNTLAAYGIRQVVVSRPAADDSPRAVGHWLSTDVGVHYTGVAGLLNLLIILDAVGRAEVPRPPGRDRRALRGGAP